LSKTNHAETAVIDWLLGGSAPTRPSARYLALHTASPGEDGSAGELSGNGYARQAATFAAASGGTTTNTSAHSFTADGADWGLVTHFSIWDAASLGNCLYAGALSTARTIADGDSATVAAGALVVTED
jgi:hypothetical protein